MLSRALSLERLRDHVAWDLVVIGGGATGLGTALDAATRGYRTLLLERDDFAKGTSSRSTKLIHGGVRYLAQGRVGLVREALHERERLLRNAPHLVHDRAFLVPCYSWWETPYYATGLWLYDRLAGHLARGRSRTVGKAEALRLASTLEPNGLRGGVGYQDGQFDDARLAIALMRSIDDHGGTALNWVAVEGLIKAADGRIKGAEARDIETGEVFSIAAKAVVNATGVFADEVRRLDNPAEPAMIAPSRGVHLVLDRRFLPGETALLVPRTDDGRVLFAIPWHDRVVIGTTDTPVARIDREPRAAQEELDFLLKHSNRYLTTDPTPADVLSVYAGLRPLIRGGPRSSTRTAGLSREHAAFVSHSGLVTITGGKWTTYRRMADDTVGLAESVAGLKPRECVTADLKLHGWVDSPKNQDERFAIYGADASEIERLQSERPELGELLHAKLPYRLVEIVWAARFEAARTIEDVLARRTRALFLDARASLECAPRVAAILAEELGRDERWQATQVEAFKALAAGYVL